MTARGDREGSSGAYKSLIKLPAAIGDWTTYKPSRAAVKKVRLGLYSFDRLSQAELKQVHIIHYNFGRLFVKGLKSKINIGGDLYAVSCEQTSYANFVKQILQPVIHLSLNIPNISENIQVLIDLNLADSLINLSLGSINTAPAIKKLTDIEEKILSAVLTEFAGNLSQAFEGIFKTPDIKIVSSPEITIDGTIAPTSTFIFFTIEFSLADNPPGKILIGYTAEVLKTLITKHKDVTESKPINLMKLPLAIQESISIPVTGYLAATSIPTQDLKTMELGDVVTLDATLESLLPIILGSRVELTGRAGVKNGRISMRLLGLGREAHGEKVEKIEEEGFGAEKRPQELEYPLEKAEEEEYPIEEEEETEEDLLEEEEFPEEKGEI